ncbi:MAG: hypothetical protein WCW78_00900 [Candidatus Paceibacterota bacterium]|jgi:hypothetical protein
MLAENKKIIGIAVVAAIFVIAAFVFFVPVKKDTQPTSDNKRIGATNEGYVSSSTNALPTVEGGTRTAVEMNIPTPGSGAASPSLKDVAIPTEVIPTGGLGFRKFIIRGEGNKFIPSTIVVNELDIIDLTFEAVDTNYNLYFPDFAVLINAGKGSSGKAQFQATQYGQYQFTCMDCGNEMKGTLIINKK